MSLDSLDRDAAPLSGGARLLARGVGLVPHGCHAAAAAEPKKCRWVNPHVDASDAQERGIVTEILQPATVSDWRGALVCHAPPMPHGWEVSLLLNFSVSLNSYDWEVRSRA